MWMKDSNAEWMQHYNPDEDSIVIALILAIEFGDWKSVQVLVPIQTNINARDSSELYWTPLMYAVRQESLNIVKLLVDAGADVNIRGSDPDDFSLNLAAYGCNAFPYSSKYDRNKAIFDYLAPLTSPELREIAQKNLPERLRKNCDRLIEDFIEAAEANQIEAVQKAIINGINVDSIGINGETALHKASYWGHIAVVNLLIEAGCNLNAKEEENQYTPLIYAVRFGYTFKGYETKKQEVAQLLIKAGADINLANKNCRTALIESTQSGNIQMVKFLIAEKANVNTRDNQGYTALSYARKAGHNEIVQFLPQAGATED